MTREELYARLCRRDPRHPEHDPEDKEDVDGECSCDAHFYGRHKLADFALSLLDHVEEREDRAST